MRTALLNARGKRTQIEVSSDLEISQKYLSKLELGHRNPSMVIAAKISKYYNIPIDKLFPDIFLCSNTP